MSSTFNGLYIAKSGVQAARTNLNTTGQNITNTNTKGYTRQRVDQSSVAPTSINMLYAGTGAIVGEGVTTTGISQLRNKFLDGQYRTQNAQYGLTSTQLSALQNIEEALNETTSDGISAAYGDFIEQLEGLTSTGSSTATESTVKEAASLLATKLNTAASQLQTIRNQQYDYLDEYGVDKVNSLLKSIASLSDQIKSADIAGTPALELMDNRNMMIDELSEYVNIRVVETPTDIGAGKSVDTLSIYLADNSGDTLKSSTFEADGTKTPEEKAVCLVDGNQVGSLSLSNTSSQDHAVIVVKNTDGETCGTTADDSNSLIQGGSLNGYLSLLNDSGEYDTPSGEITDTERGIGYYDKMLDTLAQQLASVMNADNSTNDAGDNKPMFTDSDGKTDAITAANIRISPSWTSNYLTLSKDTAHAGDDTSGSNSNITKMISDLTTSQYTLATPNGIDLFTGTMQEAVGNVSLTLGQNIDAIDAQDSANSAMLDNIDTRRQSLSSVDTNEEAINLVVYNQALSASARFMTTVDECLNTLINNMGIVGRG
ncbi:MAG: flagellar hook-associated protein FlgK [Oscillospiraceae bacterium]|jgi:flagellar hook-associated protein 1 FlgK|nr:flagellar hook-associated protein FlgK [Oscillospiraceae bacterium]